MDKNAYELYAADEAMLKQCYKNVYELYDPDEPDLKQYYKEYHLWLKDFKKTDEFNKMVVDYKSDWIKLFGEEFHRIFEHDVWLKRHGYWLTKQYLMDRETRKITVYDSVTLEPADNLSYYKK